ncbi:MAG TPA: restriction endonuclease [Solirubrobacteraceae bacterium]
MGPVTKGRSLEAAVAEFLAAEGYLTRQNEVLTGRSGITHEVDVLAEKSDGLMTFRVMVECKNWRGQADKAVIAKAAHVAGDLRLSKAIVACVGGCEPGARQTAAELGVEVWGSEEIAEHLGALSLRELRGGPAAKTDGLGYTVSVSPTAARALIAREARGTLGLGGEQIIRDALVWVPGLIQTIGVSRVEGRVNKAVRHHTVWVAYEAITGALTGRLLQAPPLERVAIEHAVLPAEVTPREVDEKIRKAAARLLEVTQKTARANAAAALRRLGVLDEREAKAESEGAACFRAAEINATEHVVRPVYLAITERKTQRRVIAVDGHTGRLVPIIGQVLIGQVTRVDEALTRHQISRAHPS